MKWNVVCLGALALAVAACASPMGDENASATPVMTFDEYQAATPIEPSSGLFLLGGDMLVTRERLRVAYDEYVRQVTGVGTTSSALTIAQVGGVDDRWPDQVKRNITYCVSTKFDSGPASYVPPYATVVTATAEAALAWSSVADVNFRHVASADSACDNANPSVQLRIVPTSQSQYVALPSTPAGQRVLALGYVLTQYPGNMRHLLGHALGFLHEEVRGPAPPPPPPPQPPPAPAPPVGRCVDGAEYTPEKPWRGVTVFDPLSVMEVQESCARPSTLSYLDKVGAALVYGASPRLFTGRYTGDFDGDSRSDVAFLYEDGPMDTSIRVSYSNGSALTAPVTVWRSLSGPWEAKRSQPVVGDFDGDGKADIAVLYDYGSNDTAIFVWRSQGRTFAEPYQFWRSGPGSFDAARAKATVGDFNADGKADIAVLYDYGNLLSGVSVFLSTGSVFSPPISIWSSGANNWGWQNTKIAAGDFNNDGRSDIAYLYDYDNSDTALFFTLSTPLGFSAPSQRWRSGPGKWSWSRSRLLTGNFDGLPGTDVALVYNQSEVSTGISVLASNGSGGVVSGPVSWWSTVRGQSTFAWDRFQPAVGDFDGDGRSDIAGLYEGSQVSAAIVRFRSKGTSFERATNFLGADDWKSGVNQWNALSTRTF